MSREASKLIKKPRIAAYGVFVFDATMRALRGWLDYKSRRVCTTGNVIPPGNTVWIYWIRPVKRIVIDDMRSVLLKWGYWPSEGDQSHARKALSWRYDCDNPYPISEGDAAVVKQPRAAEGKPRAGRRKAQERSLYK